jgi:hypothetical protein
MRRGEQRRGSHTSRCKRDVTRGFRSSVSSVRGRYLSTHITMMPEVGGGTLMCKSKHRGGGGVGAEVGGARGEQR